MNRRAIALTAANLFVFSWVFPVGAGLVRNPTSLPQWWATVDVALAFVVAVGALVIQGLGHGNVEKQAEWTTYRLYRSSLHALLVVGVLVMLAGDRIKWANCATGFLWRTWLFLYILPWWLAAARPVPCGVSSMRCSISGALLLPIVTSAVGVFKMEKVCPAGAERLLVTARD